jgi:hypothetical protein
MVRWYDGLFGGLLAGLAVVIFYFVVSVLWLHETTLGGFFAEIASGVLHGRDHLDQNGWAIAFGVSLHFLLAATFGILYSLLARRISSMWHAPTSIVWGVCFGLVVWAVISDVLVPLLGIDSTQPLWEGIVGNTLFYGFVISEFMTVMHRRQTEAA